MRHKLPYRLTVTQDVINITSDSWTFDESWRFIDANGHEHAGNAIHRTLDRIVDASHWCAGDEGWMPHEAHMVDDVVHYECKLCRETVEPRLSPPGTPTFMLGQVDATLTGARRTDGAVIVMYVDEKDVALLQNDPDGSIGQAMLDNATDERIYSWKRTS